MTKRRRTSISLSYAILILLLVVTAISLWLNLRHASHHHEELAAQMGRTLLRSIIATRQWNAEHGGFYLPVSDVIRPNPYLRDPHRDIVTTEGMRLTKINPAYMTRLLADELHKGQDVLIHITSLEPVNPGNRPDRWEERALTRFSGGEAEVWSIEPGKEGGCFRLMTPLRSDAACFHCHNMTETRRPGMVLGGISVSFPYAPFGRAYAVQRTQIIVIHSLFFLLAMAILVVFSRVNGDLKREIADRSRAEERARAANVDLERRVAKRTAALEAANRELEAFNYSVSHDLRSPLTSIDGFGRILLEDYGERLDGKGKEHLERIIAAGRQMNLLIEALLSLARLGREEIRRETVDLSVLFATVADELRFRFPERRVELSIGDLMVVRGDRRLLRAVAENLLGNAWKYTGKREDAVIEVGKREMEGETVYFVRDNGAGFDLARAHRLFSPFERLHRRDEFEGSGIGLATVRRIIERHGGEIWVEAEEGKGATFFFTLGEGE
ncbi:ATP-binding protein [Geobacter sp.]|uniref:sensor histidine kinase n=1 Tax=Geobacter sp. TaxID=46610 RepID=UPI00261411D9|nr:ATP-binding protein [Geobacter sp.]